MRSGKSFKLLLMSADKILANADKARATSGPYKDGVFKDIPIAYLQTSGQKVHEETLRTCAKSRSGSQNLNP